MNLGLFLATLRKKRGLSQNDVASFLGYSPQLISLWEKGKVSPDLTIISKYADYLGVDLEGFIECIEQKNNSLCSDKNFDINTFATFIKGLRKNSNLLQADVAHKLHINVKNIGAWENASSTPSIEQFKLLCDVYKLSYDELYFCFMDENKKPSSKKKKKVMFLPIFIPIVVTVSLAGVGTGVGIALSNNRRKTTNLSNDSSVVITSNTSQTSSGTSYDDASSSLTETSNQDSSSSEIVISSEDSSFSETYTSSEESSSTSSSSESSSSETKTSSAGGTSATTSSDENIIVVDNLTINKVTKKAIYGLYPQSYIDDASLISTLNTLSYSGVNDWYLYNDDYYTYDSTGWYKCEPISWKVIYSENNEFTLVSDYLLDVQCYYHSIMDRTIGGKTIYPSNYEHSDIRYWLNNQFFDTAFVLGNTHIKTTVVDNSISSTGDISNPYLCNNTEDKVYLLSYEDFNNVKYGLNVDTKRKCPVSQWARRHNAYVDGGYSYYWTRTPSNSDPIVPWCVQQNGTLYTTYGGNASVTNCCVRPAITVTI